METLVIGGTRFVGLHLVWELVRRGHEVTVLDRGQTPACLPEGTKRIYCDRKDTAALEDCLAHKQYDVVFDIMAYLPGDTAPLVRIFDGRIERFVHVSTASVYRQVYVYPWKEHFAKVSSVTEGEYAPNKQRIEEILFEAHSKSGFPVCIVRPGYIYGPHNSVYRESSFFDRVVKGRPVLIPGDGSQLIQFGYVDDLARLLILAAEKHEAVGEAFNFAGEYCYTLNDYVEAIFAAAGQRTSVVHFTPQRAGISASDVARVYPYLRQNHLVIDIAKSQYVLGYTEQVGLKQGLSEAFKWFTMSHIERKQVDFSFEDRIIEAMQRA